MRNDVGSGGGKQKNGHLIGKGYLPLEKVEMTPLVKQNAVKIKSLIGIYFLFE